MTLTSSGPGQQERVASGAPAPEAVVLRRMRIRQLFARYSVLGMVVIAFVIFAGLEPSRFLTLETMEIMVEHAAVGAMVALGVTFVLVLRQFDLSIVGVMGLSGAVAVDLMLRGWAWPLACAVTVLIGLLIGLLNGVFVAWVGASSFIATLATGSVATALEFWISGQVQINEGIPDTFTGLGTARFLGLGVPTWAMLGGAFGLWVLLERTEYGRRLRAVGGSGQAARFSGIRTDLVQIGAFALLGVTAAITGVTLVADSAAYAPDAGASLLIPTYAAAFIGAAVLRPGVPTIVGTLLGLLFLKLVESGLTVVGIAGWSSQVVVGFVLMVAIILSRIGADHG